MCHFSVEVAAESSKWLWVIEIQRATWCPCVPEANVGENLLVVNFSSLLIMLLDFDRSLQARVVTRAELFRSVEILLH